jgi:phosphate transport system permease protein
MSVATRTARDVTRSVTSSRRRDRNPGSLIFLVALWFSLFFGVMVLVVLIADTAIQGSPRFDSALITDHASRVDPSGTGFRAGILCRTWPRSRPSSTVCWRSR